MKYKKRFVTAAMMFLMIVAVFLSAGTVEAKKKKKKKLTSLAKATITLSKTKYTYNGKAKKPSVTVKIGKKKLSKKKDFTITYSKNKKVGKSKVTVKAKKKSKKCKGKKTKSFRIVKAGRSIIPAKTSYTAVEGDGAFYITAKASKGSGSITYSCNTSNVISVSKTGKVTVKKRGTAKVTIKVAATKNYKAASATVTVTISKKPVRAVNSAESVKNYPYPVLNYGCKNTKLTDFEWRIVTKYQLPGLAPTADDDLTKGYIQCNNLCPQGMCFAGKYMLTSSYCMDDVHNSCIFIYDRQTGEYLKTLVLKKKSHVGGIAFDGENIWICHADSYDLQRISYLSLEKYAVGKKGWIQPDELELKEISSKPSAIAYNKLDGYLWVAQYNKKNSTKMYAYKYEAGELIPVHKYVNNIERDFLGVTVADVKTPEVKPEPEENVSGPAINVSGPAISVSGPAVSVSGPAISVSGPAVSVSGPAVSVSGPAVSVSGPAVSVSGAAVSVVHVPLGGLKNAEGKIVNLQVGDVITQLGECRIFSKEDLHRELEKYKSGDDVFLQINRKNNQGIWELYSGTVVLGARGTHLYRKIPDRVQGLVFTDSGKVIFSRSTGRNTSKTYFMSELMIYDATWSTNPSESYVWKEIMAVALPPMAEEIELDGDELYIIFESAATTYLEGTDGAGKSDSPIDQIVAVKLNLEEIIKN